MSGNTSITEINTSFSELEYPQEAIIQKMIAYYAQYNSKLPFNSHAGICNGLVAFWLYSKRVDEEGRFLDKILHMLQWTSGSDAKVDELLNATLFLHNDFKLRHDAKQSHLDKSVNFILGNHYPAVAEPEFQVSLVVNHESLEYMINNFFHENKMIRIGNGFHVIGLMHSNGKFFLYDPRFAKGPKAFTDHKMLTEQIFESCAYYCRSTISLAINIAIFDLSEATPGKYFTNEELINKLLETKLFKQQLLEHPNILSLCIRYEDTFALEKLFQLGYKYIPWQYEDASELGTLVTRGNKQVLKYLIEKGIPIDYKGPFLNSQTALGVAIATHNVAICYLLLSMRSNPNIPHWKDWSALKMAAFIKDESIIVLLLAFGAEINKPEAEMLIQKFTEAEIKNILSKAEKLIFRLFGNTKDLHISDVTAHVVHYQEHPRIEPITFYRKPKEISAKLDFEEVEQALRPSIQ